MMVLYKRSYEYYEMVRGYIINVFCYMYIYVVGPYADFWKRGCQHFWRKTIWFWKQSAIHRIFTFVVCPDILLENTPGWDIKNRMVEPLTVDVVD